MNFMCVFKFILSRISIKTNDKLSISHLSDLLFRLEKIK
jgi:hypothetical protein